MFKTKYRIIEDENMTSFGLNKKPFVFSIHYKNFLFWNTFSYNNFELKRKLFEKNGLKRFYDFDHSVSDGIIFPDYSTAEKCLFLIVEDKLKNKKQYRKIIKNFSEKELEDIVLIKDIVE